MHRNLMNYWRSMVLSVFIIEIFKRWLSKYLNFWMDYPLKLWMKSSRLNHQPHTIWGIKMNYIVQIPKQWRMGLSQSRLWHLKFAQWCLRNWKTLNLYILTKKYKEIETKLSMLVTQNLLATFSFYIIKLE